MRLSHKSATAVVIVALGVFSSASGVEPPLPNGRRLREIVAEKFPTGRVLIGGTTGWVKRSGGSGVTIDREFDYITPENDFKQSTVHPSPGIWSWEAADAWVYHTAARRKVLRMHSPIGPQCSTWAKEDARTAAELQTNLEEFMTALSRRYAQHPHVQWMDVVNETVLPDGTWNGPKAGTVDPECPWLKIGVDAHHPLKPPLFIKQAFAIATHNTPANIKLIINQHNGMQTPMWETVKSLVLYLRGEHLRVDGIGWQAHVDVGWENQPNNLRRLNDLIEWAHANGLSFHVTENTVWLKEEKDYLAQAYTYAAILRTLLAHRRNGIVTWNTWNLSDKEAWAQTREYDGCIFDEQYKPKPAYFALQMLLENPPPEE